MLHGDISNRAEPRLLLVFEGLIATLPDAKARAKFDLFTRLGQWPRAMRQFRINEMCARVVWDTTMRYGYSVDVVTFISEEAVEPLTDFLDSQSLPVGHVTYSDKTLLARELNYRPDVVGVFHADPADVFMYGSKGFLVDPAHPIFVGA